MLRLPILALAALACEPAPSCEIGASTEAATPVDRKLLGAAADYPADSDLEAHYPELLTSQRARRAAAWRAVARVLAPVQVEDHHVPLFRTFYDREDTARIFQHLYAEMSPDERAARARLDPELVDGAFVWNVGFADQLGMWPDDRWREYVEALEDPLRLNAVGGLRRLTLSPSATRHVIESYPELLRCLEQGGPGPDAEVEQRTDRLLRTPVVARGCGEQRFGPFAIERGASLTARLDAEAPFTLELTGETGVHCSGDHECTVEGPNVVHAFVRTEGPLEGILEIDRTRPIAPTACLDGAFPIDSVSIAAEWRRADEMELPVYDTSASALRALVAEPFPTWAEAGTSDPGADSIYTQRTASGATYRLVAFHMRTRELPSWLNVTVWWSPDPESDFGADRPDEIRALGGPWSSYKMCVSVDYAEHDADPSGGADDASLAEALAAVHEGPGGPSWCSNPYIDAAPGLGRGNCVGCHQHAMTGVRPGDVATQPDHYPENGRTQLRNNYPADGYWGLDAGDELALLLQEVVDYWEE
jgi:hypothetical protein